MMSTNREFSRERLAGYNPDVLGQARILLVGLGAAGTNCAQSAALCGVGELLLSDHDHVELSNLTRSPLLEASDAEQVRSKVEAAARSLRRIHRSPRSVIRCAPSRIQELGNGAMACADVIVSCVDNDEARAFLATESRFLGKPLVEVGFRGPQTNLAVYPNLDADEPCFLCHSPDASPTSVSCRLFAAEQEQIGMAPAIQPAAAIVGGLALEAAIMALHHEFPLGSKQLFFDIRQGRFSSARLTTSPRCPGPHRLWSQPAKLDVTTHDTVRVLLEAVSRLVRNPVLLLHSPYILRAACPTCGRSMDVRRLAWNLKSFPPCGKCTREYTQTAEPPLEVYSRVSFEDEELVGMSCSELGLHPLTVIEVSSLRSEELMIVQLAGDIEDLFPLNIAGNRHSSDDS